MKKQTKHSRLQSLDILRGITVAAMILVNNPGSWTDIYPPLRHADWIGITPTDMVFPLFMFIMGVSLYLSLSNHIGNASWKVWRKIIKRSVLLFVFGMGLSWLALVLSALLQMYNGEYVSITQALFPLGQIRILGVLQRLAISYFFGAVLLLYIPRIKTLVVVVVVIFVGYWLLLICGNGFVQTDENIIAIVDRFILGSSHMYNDWLPDGTRILFDPEGLLSTLPCIAHVLIGALCATMINNTQPLTTRILNIMLAGSSMLITGFLFAYAGPIIKKVWSPSYMLITSGIGMLLFAILTYITDIKKQKAWAYLFQAYGSNPLSLYLFASIVAILLDYIPIGNDSLHDTIYSTILNFTAIPQLASVFYALMYVAFNGLIAVVLYRKHIFIKL